MSSVRNIADKQRASDDERLLQLITSGDNQALSELYDRYSRIVYGLAIKMLGSAELAEDVVQETFWRVWRRSGSFHSARGHVASWIFGIAHNLTIDELRRQRSRPTPVYDTEERPVLRDLEDSSSNAFDLALEDERRRLIASALQQIPPEQREVLELVYFRGLSQTEIAEHLQNPVGTVKTRVRLGLTKLRDILTTQGFNREDLAS